MTEPESKIDLLTAPQGEIELYQNADVRHTSLAAAKLAVMKDVGYAMMRRSEPGQAGLPYAYVREAELLKVLRPPMIRNGITMSPVRVQPVDQSQFESKNKTMQFKFRCIVTYRMTAVLDGGKTEFEDIEVPGDAHDSGDKATPKAMTIALKYALRQAFLMVTGQDADDFESQPVMRLENAMDGEQVASFNKFIGAIDAAESIAKLNVYHDAYRKREFTEHQLAQLDEAYGKRKTAIEKK